MKYIIVGVKNGVPYYWCYDYITEYRAKGALVTRAKVREKLKEFDTVEVREVDMCLFCNCAEWKTKEQILDWFYDDVLHAEENYGWLWDSIKEYEIKWINDRYKYAIEKL